MSSDLLGPANAVNAVTARPSETRIFGASDTYFKDCSTSTNEDGTEVQAAWLNAQMQQLRHAIRGMGITEELAVSHLFRRLVRAGSSYGDDEFYVSAFSAQAGTMLSQ